MRSWDAWVTHPTQPTYSPSPDKQVYLKAVSKFRLFYHLTHGDLRGQWKWPSISASFIGHRSSGNGRYGKRDMCTAVAIFEHTSSFRNKQRSRVWTCGLFVPLAWHSFVLLQKGRSVTVVLCCSLNSECKWVTVLERLDYWRNPQRCSEAVCLLKKLASLGACMHTESLPTVPCHWSLSHPSHLAASPPTPHCQWGAIDVQQTLRWRLLWPGSQWALTPITAGGHCGSQHTVDR